MAHALETHNGEVAFALRGEPAWHGLANVLFDKDEHINTSTMLDSAKLSNWDIQLEEVAIPVDYRSDKSNYFVTRTNPFDNGKDILAIVGSKYQVVQNEQLLLNLALGSVKQSFKLRHTQSIDGKIQVAREALNLTFNYMDKFEEEAQSLFNTKVDDKKFFDIITAIYPKPDKDATKAQLTKWDNKIVLLNSLYHESPTNENIKGTAWGVLNALTERLDYFKQERKNNLENRLASASGFDAMSNAEKNKLFSKVKQLANVA